MRTDREELQCLARNLERAMRSHVDESGAADPLTQTALSELSGVPQGAISCILHAKHDPSYCVVMKLADALDVSIEWLRRRAARKIPELVA
jgi:transcriptional regulator with XRE-family HTH domain